MQGKEFRSYLEKELDEGVYADLETMDARMLWGGGSLHIEDVPEAVTTASERARDIIGEILDVAEKRFTRTLRESPPQVGRGKHHSPMRSLTRRESPRMGGENLAILAAPSLTLCQLFLDPLDLLIHRLTKNTFNELGSANFQRRR